MKDLISKRISNLNFKYILYFLVLFLFLFIRLVGIRGDIVNTDAERWHRRSDAFLEALKQHEFKNTYQRYHPGITLMWFNSIVKYVSYKYQLTYTQTPLTLENADYFINIHAISKSFNIFIYALLLIMQLVLIRKLFGDKVGLLYAFLLSVEPYFIGINRWFHQTSFEVMFAFISLLALLVWYKESKLKYLIFSTFALAFSVLAKVTSLILFPVLLVVFLYRFYTLYTQTKTSKKILPKSDFINLFMKELLTPLCLFGILFSVFIFVFFPALWVDPVFVWNQMYGAIFNAVTDNVRADMLSGIIYYLYYSIILIFKLSPITLVLFVVSIWSLRRSKDFNVLVLVIAIINYYLFLTITEQKIDRYSLIFIPFIALLSSIYLSSVSITKIYICSGLSVLFLFFTIYKYYPVYSAYYSPLFGNTEKALSLGVYDNSGEYFAQAAVYLNSQGRDKYTYVPNGFSSFNLLYKGHIQREYTEQTNYIVKSLDMDRTTVNVIRDKNCTKIVKEFGPRNTIPIVYIWGCD